METKQEREARLRRMADIGRAHIVRYRETGEGKPIPPPKPWLYAPKPTECGKCKTDLEFAALVEAAEMPVHEAVESALLKSAISGNVTAQIFYLCNRQPDRWTHVNQVHVDNRTQVLNFGVDEALQAKIMSMGMAGLTEPEEDHDEP